MRNILYAKCCESIQIITGKGDADLLADAGQGLGAKTEADLVNISMQSNPMRKIVTKEEHDAEALVQSKRKNAALEAEARDGGVMLQH